MPTNAQTALILAHYSAVILAPPHASFTNFSELSGKRIAVIETETSDDANRNLLATIESQYSLAPDSIKRVATSVSELPRLLQAGEIDAVFAFGLFDAPHIAEARPALFPTLAPALAPLSSFPFAKRRPSPKSFPGSKQNEILRGAFGGSPSRPAENIETIGATVRLVG